MEVPAMASAISSGRKKAWLYVGLALSSLLAALVFTLLIPDFAWAQDDDPTEKIRAVLDNIRNWIVGIAAVLVVVMLTIAGVRYLLANDPSEAERAKVALKAAAIGFAIILLAPFLVAILAEILAG
jgi:cytochrome bd-type quinol oxidase subunit 2